MSAHCGNSETSSPLFTRRLRTHTSPVAKKMPNDPDANEPGTMPDEDLAIESPEYEDDDDFDMAPHPRRDEERIGDEQPVPANTPRGPR